MGLFKKLVKGKRSIESKLDERKLEKLRDRRRYKEEKARRYRNIDRELNKIEKAEKVIGRGSKSSPLKNIGTNFKDAADAFQKSPILNSLAEASRRETEAFFGYEQPRKRKKKTKKRKPKEIVIKLK